jgi:hypothetical protein
VCRISAASKLKTNNTAEQRAGSVPDVLSKRGEQTEERLAPPKRTGSEEVEWTVAEPVSPASDLTKDSTPRSAADDDAGFFQPAVSALELPGQREGGTEEEDEELLL